jgi:hypothetical protein
MAFNPFNILENLYNNTIFAPPRAVQGAQAAAEAEALAQEQKVELERLAAIRRAQGLQTLGGMLKPGALGRQELWKNALTDPKGSGIVDWFLGGGKVEDLQRFIEGGTPEPLKPGSFSPGEVYAAPDEQGIMQEVFRNPTTEQVDNKEKGKQAAAQAEAIGMLSKYLSQGLSRQQVYQKALGDKALMKKWKAEGHGSEASLQTLIEGGTSKPLEPINTSPGTVTRVPNAEGTGYNTVATTPTAEEQRYVEIETRFGPEVTQRIFDIAGPGMNPTEKQAAALELMRANPGNKQLEATLRKVRSGLIEIVDVYDPISGRYVKTVKDHSLPGEVAPSAPVATGTSVLPTPDPTKGGQIPVPMQQQAGTPGAQPPYLPQFTPPKPLPPGMAMPAGKAAFELGPPGVVADVLNYIFAPPGLTYTIEGRQDALASLNTLADVSREYFQNSGRPLAADVQLVVSRLPKGGGFWRGFFDVPVKALSMMKSVRDQIERDMTYHAGILAKASKGVKFDDKVIAEAQAAFTRGENAIQYFPTEEEFKSYFDQARKAESKGISGVGSEIMKRWKNAIEGDPAIHDFMAPGEEETLDQKEERLTRELQELERKRDLDRSEAEELADPNVDEDPADEPTFEPDTNLNDIFSPDSTDREKELIKELRSLEQQTLAPVPLGDGTFANPAAEQTVIGADGEPVSAEQRIQEITDELGALADQRALRIRQKRVEREATRAAKRTGLPESVFHAAAGVNASIAEMMSVPVAVARKGMIAIGAAKLMNPEWQSGRSTESLFKDYLTSRGYPVDVPDGSISGQVGEAAFTGATLAFGLAVAGPRLAIMKGPKALKFAQQWIGKLFSEGKGVATATGAVGGGMVGASGELAKQAGLGETGQAVVEIATGFLAPGAGTVRQVGRMKKVGENIAERFKTRGQGALRPEGPGAEMVQQYGRQMASAVTKKAKNQKGTLATFTKMDPDKAIASIFSNKNPEGKMREILAATTKSKDAREGLRRGVIDWLFTKGNVKDPSFSPAGFEKIWNDKSNQRALRLVLPKNTVDRIDNALKAEMKLAHGPKATKRPLRRMAMGLATGGASTAVGMLGRLAGAQLARYMGITTIQGTGVAASKGQKLAMKWLGGINTPSDVLLREALLDPAFERLLLKRGAKAEARGEKTGMATTVGGIIGTEEALDDSDVE